MNLHIFPGWASPDEMYMELGKDIFDNVIIHRNDSGFNEIKGEDVVAGWSMGAMRVIENIDRIENKASYLLISPCLNFTESHSKAAIKKMIRDLGRDREKVITEFLQLSSFTGEISLEYYRKYGNNIGKISKEELENGLNYLCEKRLEVPKKKNTEIFALISENDRVIKPELSVAAVNKLEVKDVVTVNLCGHNIIYEKPEVVDGILRRIIDDRKRES